MLTQTAAPSPVLDDRSVRPGLFLQSLTDAQGTPYPTFRAALKPRWWRVWTELATTWLLLLGVAVALIASQQALPAAWGLLVVPVGALAFGMLVHHISCFLHEGAHFNLARTRRASDALANAAAGGLVLMDIRSYRVVHLAHHRNLGTTRDTERSYFQPPDGRFVLRSVTGAAVIDVLRNRSEVASKHEARHLLVPAIGAALHVAVVIGALLTGHLWLAIAWFFGVLSLYPLLNALRQNLEHRTETARADVDYTLVDQGYVTRCFADTFGALLIGGVGFSRHLVHHWDPGLSYTNLPDTERFLRATDAAPLLAARSTSYWKTWRALRGAP